ncbi:MAG: MinD/ParA family protein [Deltaproteobacteria bacterium]|nr:MinD/ParA family protein [Candidatus Anaeroferrophillacea bacterium]
MDQAASLHHRTVKVIAIASGKGGVGKTNIVANLGCALADLGERVLILDADLGLGNLDVLLGYAPQYNLAHVFAGEKTLAEVMVTGPKGIRIIPASSGIQEITRYGGMEQRILLDQLDQLEEEFDYLFVDTAAGISDLVTSFSRAAHEVVVVVTPEPTSLTDAYALVKVLNRQYGESRFMLLPNMVKNREEADAVYRKLNLVCEKFLDISLDSLGYIPHDPAVSRAVRRQRAVVDADPAAPVSRSFQLVAGELQRRTIQPKAGGLQFFWRRILDGEPARE